MMIFGYDELFSELAKYLDCFSENGFDENRARRIKELLSSDEDTPLDRVFSVFGCNEFDRCALALALLAAASSLAADTVSKISGARKGFVTPAAVSSIFYGLGDIIPFCQSLSEDSPLCRLLDGVSESQGSPMTVKDFVTAFVFSGIISDEAFEPSDGQEAVYLPLKDNERVQREIVSFLKCNDPSVPFVLQISGETGCGRHTALRRAFRSAGRDQIFLTLPADAPRQRITELASKLLLTGAVPVLEARGGEDLCRVLRLLADETGLCAVINERELDPKELCLPVFTVRLKRPDADEQLLVWQKMTEGLPIEKDADLSEITGEFDMTPADIGRAVSFALMLEGNGGLTLGGIKKGCYRSFASDMGDKAVRLEAVFGWDDIVLPERSRALLSQACSQVRLRHRVYSGWGFSEKLPYGRGVSMIFTGPPGTGKTMGAQVMAKELEMDIYRVSLANVVSKYIGETEKNLNGIFERAKSCRVILFFDEADVLFSKRTEVRDSNDKYSNMESAFLLQKMEEYSGVVILATNLVQNFDEAFKRRMSYIIEFPFPDASRRRELWAKAFPARTPLGDIDFDFLVENYELSGSNIKNIALQSAFLAAAENSSTVEMKHIMRSVRNEFAKSGKAFTKAEAGEYHFLLSDV